MDTIRIVGWNIRAGGGRRVEAIAEQLARWRCDIAALSEFRGTAPSRRLSEALAAQGLTYQRSTATPSAENRLLVASRWPLRRLSQRAAPAEAGRWLLVAVAASRPFALATLHAPNRVTGRKYPYLDAIATICRGWRGGPAVLVGDTNSGRIGLDEESPAFNRREDAWICGLETAGWRDAYRHFNVDARSYTWYSPNGRNGFRLDQAFVNRKLAPRLLSAEYVWGSASDPPARREELSDHAALIVELEV